MNFRLFSGLTLLLVLSFSTGCVSRLFYHPSPILRETPEVLGIDYEDVYFPSEDGTRLHGWFLPARTQPGWATVVQLHGNAHNVSSHYRYVTWLVAEGVNVLCFDYRGYGLSEGKPERAGILKDSRAAIRYAASRPDVDPDRIVLLGQSLGGANAVVAAATLQDVTVRGVIVDSAFYSYRSIVADKIKLIPVLAWFRAPLSWILIGNRYSPGPVIGSLAPMPLLFFHSIEDPVVPVSHTHRLYEAAGEPKQLYLIDQRGHIDALGSQRDRMRPRVLAFIRSAVESDQGSDN